jgi:hypothetical protein
MFKCDPLAGRNSFISSNPNPLPHILMNPNDELTVWVTAMLYKSHRISLLLRVDHVALTDINAIIRHVSLTLFNFSDIFSDDLVFWKGHDGLCSPSHSRVAVLIAFEFFHNKKCTALCLYLFWRCEPVATICFTERAIAFVALPTKLILLAHSLWTQFGWFCLHWHVICLPFNLAEDLVFNASFAVKTCMSMPQSFLVMGV